MEELELGDISGGDVKWCSRLGKQQFLKMLNMELSFNPVIPLLGI